MAVVTDQRPVAGQGRREVVPVVTAEDELEATAQPGSDVGLGRAAGAVAAVEGGQRSEDVDGGPPIAGWGVE